MRKTACLTFAILGCSSGLLSACNAPIIEEPRRASSAAIANDVAPTDLVTVHPTEVTAAFKNPGKGWLMYDFAAMTAPGGALATPLASAVYTNQISWGDVEPYEGVYRWFLIDRVLNAYPDRKIRLGITLLDPTSRPWYGATGNGQVPTWLWQQLCPTGDACRGRWASVWGGKALNDPSIVATTKADAQSLLFEPQYWDATFLEHHRRFVRALATRYFNNDEATAGYAGAPDWSRRVESIDMATYGTWGEWHSEIEWPSRDVMRTTLRTMANHYHDAFGELARATGKPKPELEQSAIASSASSDNDVEREDDPTAIRYSIETLGSSMVRKFIGADPALFFKPDEERLVAANIGQRPFRLEWGSCTGALGPDAFSCLGGQPDSLEGAIERALGYGATYLGWYTDPTSLGASKTGTSDALEAYFQKNAGYRFTIGELMYPRTVDRGGTIAMTSSWFNRARGKCYGAFGLRAYLTRDGQPIALPTWTGFAPRSWPLGAGGPYLISPTFDLPTSIAGGAYKLELAVVDANGEPAMNLAIDGKTEMKDGYGRYLVGEIFVR